MGGRARGGKRLSVAALWLLAAACACLWACVPGGGDRTDASAGPVELAELVPASTPESTRVPEPTPDPALKPFTIAWFGDTQSYASTYPEQFDAMTRWVVDNRDALSIRYVVHTGDIVNKPEVQAEWDAARAALSRFSGALPFFSVAGNHDLVGMLTQTGQDYGRYAELMEALGLSDTPTLGGRDETWRRRYDLVTIGRDAFIFIGTGYRLSLDDYDWLNEILAQYADRTAVLIVHEYLDFDGVPRGDGRHLYRKVVMKNPNVKYVLCGHRHRVQHVIQEVDENSDRAADRSVYALMNDYQGYENGGGGYLVLLTFDPKLREIRVTSYSPVLDDYNYFEDGTIETYTLPYL